MQRITLRAYVGSDGILQLQVPVELKDKDLEVTVIYKPLPSQDESSDDLGWSPGFLEQTAGAIPDLERPPQGEAEVRESFDE